MWFKRKKTVTVPLVDLGGLYGIRLFCKRVPAIFIIDCGSEINIICQEFIDQFHDLEFVSGTDIHSVGGRVTDTFDTELSLSFDFKMFFHGIFTIQPSHSLSIYDENISGLLGLPFLECCTVDFVNGTLTVYME